MMNAFLMMMVDRWSDETVSHSFSREKKIKLNWTDKNLTENVLLHAFMSFPSPERFLC